MDLERSNFTRSSNPISPKTPRQIPYVCTYRRKDKEKPIIKTQKNTMK
jgi:hypothetical protein